MNDPKVDMAAWDRRDLYTFYMTELKIVMNMTVKMDVTHALAFSRAKGLKFHSVMMWAVGQILNARDEFRYSLDENGELIKWDMISPSYTDFNPETEHFVKFVTEYSNDLYDFCARVEIDKETHKMGCGFIPNQPKNVYDISCMPWVSYEALTLHVDAGGPCLFPVVLWGKYFEEGEKTLMPVTMNINHAVCDGFHLGRFFNELQDYLNNL